MKRNYKYDNPKRFMIQMAGILFYAVLVPFCISCGDQVKHSQEKVMGNDTQDIYYCEMHPEVMQNKPGICPKCDMALVKKDKDENLKKVLSPVNSNVVSTIKTINPKQMVLNLDVYAEGYIDFDNRTKHDISSRYTGRIEKLYIKNNYEHVMQGDRIFEIYSPELITLQQNLIYLLDNNGSEELITNTKNKLKLLGFTDKQTRELQATKKVMQSAPVFSKYTGHIHEKLDSKEISMSMTNRQQTPELSVKEGMYVERGKVIFNIVDPGEVVVMLKIKPEDISKIKKGQEVEYTVNENPEMLMTGKIDFIEPYYQAGAKSLLARVNMENHEHQHKVGSLVKAKISVEKMDGLWIPSKAVLDLGMNKIVWVKKNGNFMARKIDVGMITDQWVEVFDGLSKHDEIAAEAHYLSDSESFIKLEGE